jgi:adenine-specific DNA-methyltransferase
MKILTKLPGHEGQKVIYGEACRIDESKLKALNVIFKQIPYSIKAR